MIFNHIDFLRFLEKEEPVNSGQQTEPKPPTKSEMVLEPIENLNLTFLSVILRGNAALGYFPSSLWIDQTGNENLID